MQDNNDARLWFNAVEEVVFSDDDFCDDFTMHPFLIRSRIEAMQAAYLVCLYQNWEGSDQSKRRIRRHRFSTLVSRARDIGIHNARHLDYAERALFDWKDFAVREELIRVVLWTFLLDTAFVIFNNLPPRMVIREMTTSLASCEAVFQAETANDCLHHLSQTGATYQKADAFYRAIEVLCKDELDEKDRNQLADSGPLNLFAIASSLHPMLFQYQNNFSSENQLVPIRNALENWRLIWAEYMQGLASKTQHSPLGNTLLTPENMWKRVGFMRHASEYWLLASLMLDQICISQGQHYGGISSSFSQSTAENSKPVLPKYDETSMQQVNDLIAQLQHTTIS